MLSAVALGLRGFQVPHIATRHDPQSNTDIVY